jgi:hypothetical protein
MSNQTPPEPTPEQEQIIAEEVGAEPETFQLPPYLRRGIMVFELEDGSVGHFAITADTTVMDGYGLLSRILAGMQVDLTAAKVMELEDDKINGMRAAAQKAAQRARLMGR